MPADAQRIVDALHEPLLVLDEDLVVRQVNPAFYDTFATTPEETLGTPFFELGGGHFDHPALRGPLDTLHHDGTAFEKVELDQSFKGLGRRVLQINGNTLQVKDEVSRPILIAINDVTESRRLETKLRRHAKELKQSNEDLEQFAYAASHDLQEPLRMVASYLQLLERRYREDLDETAQEFIDYAVDGAERMKALINGLLHYSRVGRQEGQFCEVDLATTLADILDDLDRRIEDLGATADVGTLPSTYGSREQLRRLFQNLLENAFTYAGDEPPRVQVRGQINDDGAVHVVVQDEGPGIPPEAQNNIFQIFTQLDPHGTGTDGSGMGLALCKKIAERHEGRIWVESESGQGASFHVILGLSPRTDT